MVAGNFAIFQNTHHDSSTSVGASVLGKIVTARELLAALMALEWLILSVQRSVVALEVFLSAESAVTDLADKGLGWILGERLLAAASVDWRVGVLRSARFGTHDAVGSVVL